MKGLPRHQVDCLARRHRADHYRCLDAWSHLVSMVSARLSGSQSLPDLEIDRPGTACATAKARRLERESHAALQPPLPLVTDFPEQ